MDATSASSDNGFDAALKALEDLETTVAQTREETAPAASIVAPAATAAEPAQPVARAAAPAPSSVPVPVPAVEVLPTGMIDFSDSEDTAEPVSLAIPSTTDVETPAVPLSSSPSEAPAAAPVPAEPVAARTGAAHAAPARVAPVRSGIWGKVAIGIGLCSSAISAAGLVIAERVITSAQLVVADARERQEQLQQSGKLIHDLELLRDKQVQLLQAQQAQLANAPVSSEELQHRLEALQQGLVQRDPVNTVIRAINEGQTAQNARFQEFWTRLDRIDAKLGER